MADFYLRYYVGHKGKFGHEFLEFEFRPDGKYMCTYNNYYVYSYAQYKHVLYSMISMLFPGRLRYANNSNYKNDVMIRKEVTS